MEALTVEAPIAPLAETAGPALSPAPDAPATLGDVLRRASDAVVPGQVVQVARDGSETALGYDEVRDRAERILGGVRVLGAMPGDEIVLQVETIDEFAPALWACILGGFTAVPAAVASGHPGSVQAARRLRDVWATLDHPLVLAGTGAASAVRSVLGAEARVASVAELATGARDRDGYEAAPDSVAVLLLSSGTTGRPKLIQRTHHNLLRVCQASLATQAAPTAFLGWLPL
ncbi:MAG TPA: AMP-binding protein, partial [Longimicrobium sp.]|nr:AMP-binding protein [Longimicrobium sp.]